MKRLTRKRALEVALHNQEPMKYLQIPEHVLRLTCISCIGEGVVHYSSIREMEAQEEVCSREDGIEWYKTPIGYVCGACAKKDEEEE